MTRPVKSTANHIIPKELEGYGFNHKQWLFVQHYMLTRNGRQAAIKAGYKPGNAHVGAYRLLHLPKIVRFLEEEGSKYLTEQKEKLRLEQITAEETILQLARIAKPRLVLGKLIGPNGELLTPLEDLTEDETACIKEISSEPYYTWADVVEEVDEEINEGTEEGKGKKKKKTSSKKVLVGWVTRVKLHDPIRALELLGKYQGVTNFTESIQESTSDLMHTINAKDMKKQYENLSIDELKQLQMLLEKAKYGGKSLSPPSAVEDAIDVESEEVEEDTKEGTEESEDIDG